MSVSKGMILQVFFVTSRELCTPAVTNTVTGDYVVGQTGELTETAEAALFSEVARVG